MSPKLEERYITIKLSDLTQYTYTGLWNYLTDNGIPTRDCVVVEHDWPIYDEVVEKVLKQ